MLAHCRSEHIKMFGFGDLSFHCVLHKTTPMTKTPRMQWDTLTATILGSQLMSLSPLQSFSQYDFGMTAIVSSVLLEQADLPRRHLHNLGVVGQDH